MTQNHFLRGLSLALAAALSLGCDPNDPTSPEVSPTATITVDASTTTQYLAFSGEQLAPVTVADAGTSTAWDLSLFTTTIATNAGVSVYCLCENEGASGDAVMAMTADGQLAAFDAIGVDDIPPSASFTTDVFATHKWYRYNITGSDNQIWPVFVTYLVRRGTAVYKVQVINYYSAAAEPRHVTLRYARLTE